MGSPGVASGSGSLYPGDIFLSFQRYVRLGLEVAREKGLAYILLYELDSDVDILLTRVNHARSYFEARAFGRPLIHVIGDSHSWAFKRHRSFIIHNIGPATAYNLANKASTIRSNEKLFATLRRIDIKKDIVVLVFGEIDCRIHFYHQHKKSGGKLTVDDLMDRTISNYGAVMGQLRDMGVDFFVYGILPAPKHILRYPKYATEKMKKDLLDEFNGDYPHQAPPDARAELNKKFNEKLRQFCLDNGYKYIDIYPVVSDPHGFIDDHFASDEIHVNGRIMPFIKSILEKNYNIKL